MNFFNLPIGAGQNDWQFGEVDGNPIYHTPGGFSYFGQYQAPAAPYESLTTALDPQGRAVHNRAPVAKPSLMGAIDGMVGGITQGLTAPGRAARGEPVTYGDAWATALDYGALSAPTEAPAGALRSGGIRAYHGSPHDFDRFSMDKIGTGEGAQAYGHGLYFAEAEDVARSYRDALSTGRRGVDAPKFRSIGGELRSVSPDDAHDIAEGGMEALDRRIAEVSRVLNDNATYDEHVRFFGAEEADKARGYWQRELDELQGLKETGDLSLVDGHMYEVRINANPDDFLDWDAPLSEQPEKVRGAWERFKGSDMGQRYAEELGDASNMRASRYGGELRGEDILGNFMGANDAADNYREIGAQMLRGEGIPGIKYKDGMSRGGEGGTRNFVVFDEDLIEIVRKYGIAGAATYLGMPKEEIQQRMGEM